MVRSAQGVSATKPAGSGAPSSAEHDERGKRNARPRRIAHHDELPGRDALREKRAVDGDHILDRERKGMFRRQPVLGDEDPAPRVASDGFRDDEVHGAAIHGEGAAIDIEDHRRGLALRRLAAPDGGTGKPLPFSPVFPCLGRLVHFALRRPRITPGKTDPIITSDEDRATLPALPP